MIYDILSPGDRTPSLLKASPKGVGFQPSPSGTLTNVFDIQDEISLAVVSQLKVELLSQEKASTTKRTMSDVDAYNLCLLGRHHWYKFTEDGMKAARGHFEERWSWLLIPPAPMLG